MADDRFGLMLALKDQQHGQQAIAQALQQQAQELNRVIGILEALGKALGWEYSEDLKDWVDREALASLRARPRPDRRE